MKRVVFIGVFLSLMGFVLAQSGSKNLKNAYSHYSMEYYDRAKAEIDKCLEFEDTKADAKMWFYRGNIYVMLEVEKTKKDSSRYKQFENCGEVAFDAYMQAYNIDPKVESPNMNIKNIQEGLKFCSNMLVVEAYKAYGKKDFERMYQLAKKANKADDENVNAIYCLGFAAEQVGKKNEAKSNYLGLVKGLKRGNMFPYIRLAELYREEDDVPNAVKTIEAGVPFFLNDSVKEPKKPKNTRDSEDKDKEKAPRDTFDIDYAVAYSIIMIWAGRSEEAKEIMEKALQKDPNNHTMLINLGSQVMKAKKYDEAEMYFQKALNVNPNDVFSNYNMGNYYYIMSLDKGRDADTIINEVEYAKAKAESDELLQKAKPYLEKADELEPNDINTLRMLFHVYLQSKETEKLKAIEAKIKASQSK